MVALVGMCSASPSFTVREERTRGGRKERRESLQVGSAGDWGNFYQGCDRGCGSRLLLGLLGREEAQGSAGASGMRLLLLLYFISSNRNKRAKSQRNWRWL